jgi:hypothetical protein
MVRIELFFTDCISFSGMRKRGRRLITIPSHLWSHEAATLPWAAALNANCTLFVELSVQSVKFHNRTAETAAEEKSTAHCAPLAPPAPVEPEPQPIPRKSKKVVERPASPESPVKNREVVTIPTVAHVQSNVTAATPAATPVAPVAPTTRLHSHVCGAGHSIHRSQTVDGIRTRRARPQTWSAPSINGIVSRLFTGCISLISICAQRARTDQTSGKSTSARRSPEGCSRRGGG